MTTTFKQFENWIANETALVSAAFTADEAAVMKFLAPLGAQILAAAKSIGKATAQEGLQVIIASATSAVAAGAAAQASGGNAVQAAEEAFVASATTAGITVIKNAEAGAIKAAVAIAQSAIVQAQTIAQ
jgi:hypothetical protein